MKKIFFNSFLFKVITIGFLALALLIPTAIIMDLIDERAVRRDEVIMEVSSKWGSKQTIAGPVLSVPFLIHRKNKEGEVVEKHRYYAHFTPEEILINGDIDHELRHRSIYEVVLYRTALTISGNFNPVEFEKTQTHPDEILWDEAFLSIGLSDLTGLEKKMNLKWKGGTVPFESGLPTNDVLNSGVHAKVNLDADKEMKFSFDINLKGSERLSFVPIGQSTEVSIQSEWPDPSFDGDILASKREVNDAGFKATWNVLDLNRNLPNQWTGPGQNIYETSFGVTMLIPVNEYQKNMRSTKYALLIISLTFLTFFLSEVINKNNLHAFHYVLVGLGLVIFYILLLSFSEHVGFNLAYLFSSLMTILSIVFYISAVIKSRVFTIVLTTFFVIVFAFIFVILQLQDFSLLIGSIGLFAALAVTMYLTRNINWHSLGKTKTDDKVVG